MAASARCRRSRPCWSSSSASMRRVAAMGGEQAHHRQGVARGRALLRRAGGAPLRRAGEALQAPGRLEGRSRSSSAARCACSRTRSTRSDEAGRGGGAGDVGASGGRPRREVSASRFRRPLLRLLGCACGRLVWRNAGARGRIEARALEPRTGRLRTCARDVVRPDSGRELRHGVQLEHVVRPEVRLIGSPSAGSSSSRRPR